MVVFCAPLQTTTFIVYHINEISKKWYCEYYFPTMKFLWHTNYLQCHTNVMYVEPQIHGQLAMGDMGSH
jgi:hypothetical protein